MKWLPYPRTIWCGLTLIGLLAGLAVWLPTRLIPSSNPGGPPQLLRQFATLKDGRLHRTGAAQPFTGVLLDHYGSGQLQSRSQVVDGRLHGLSEGWHTNGVLQVREHFQLGVSHGIRTKWHANGAKLSEATIVLGQLEGTFQQWHESGVLARQIEMKSGKPDGWSRAFDDTGALTAQVLLKEGQPVAQVSQPNVERSASLAKKPETP